MYQVLRYANVGFAGFSIRRFFNFWEKSWEHERWLFLISFPTVCWDVFQWSFECSSGFSVPHIYTSTPTTHSSAFFSVQLNTHIQFVQFKNTYNEKWKKNKTVLHTKKNNTRYNTGKIYLGDNYKQYLLYILYVYTYIHSYIYIYIYIYI